MEQFAIKNTAALPTPSSVHAAALRRPPSRPLLDHSPFILARLLLVNPAPLSFAPDLFDFPAQFTPP